MYLEYPILAWKDDSSIDYHVEIPDFRDRIEQFSAEDLLEAMSIAKKKINEALHSMRCDGIDAPRESKIKDLDLGEEHKIAIYVLVDKATEGDE